MAKSVALVAWCGCYVAEPEGSFPRRLKPCGRHGSSPDHLLGVVRALDALADAAATVLTPGSDMVELVGKAQFLAGGVLGLRESVRTAAAELVA